MKQIRPYEDEDQDSIIQIYASSKMEELKNEKLDFHFLPLMQDEIRSKSLFESKIFVYEDPNVVGCCAYFNNEIRALYVTSEHRGKGIGHAMLLFLLNRIQGKTTLFVAKSNIQAKKLYRRNGFQITDEFETEYNGLEVMANKMERKNDHLLLKIRH